MANPFAEFAPKEEAKNPFLAFAPQQEEANPFLRFSPTEPTPETQSGWRQVADVPLHAATGVVEGVRMVADAFGANNPISKNLRGVEDYISAMYSAQSKKDEKEVSRIMQEAEDKGVGDQVLAAVKAFSVAPVDILTKVLGNAAPSIVGGMATYLLRGGAAAATAVGAGTGISMGAGSVKGSIYDAVKDALSTTDMSPEQIEKRAELAQAYNGKNLIPILGGAALGAIGATSGLEPMLARQMAKRIVGMGEGKILQREALEAVEKKAAKEMAERGATKQGVRTAAQEAGTEFGQESEEKLAENIALQNEGFDVPTWRGVAGAGTMGALSAVGPGGYAGASSASRARKQEQMLNSEAGRKYQAIMDLNALEEKQQRIDELQQKAEPTKQEQVELGALQKSVVDTTQALKEEGVITAATKAQPPASKQETELESLKRQLAEVTAKMEQQEQRYGEPFEETIDDYMSLKELVAEKTRAAETDVEREMRLEREAINAEPVAEGLPEGPEPPDIFAPTQVEPTTKAPEDQAPAELIQAPEVATQSPLDAIPKEDRARVEDNIADYEASGFTREESTHYALEDYKYDQEADALYAAEEAVEAKKDEVRKIARANFDGAIDTAPGSDYNGDYDAAFEAYRHNLFDTLSEQGLTKGEDRDLILNVADREFNRLIEEHKAKQPKTEAAPVLTDPLLDNIQKSDALIAQSEALAKEIEKVSDALDRLPYSEQRDSPLRQKLDELKAQDDEILAQVDELVAERKKLVTKKEPAPFDAQATVAKIEDEGVYHSYNTATEALAQGDEIYALDVGNEFDIANTLNSIQRLTTPEQILAAAKEKLTLYGIETEAGNAARADAIMDQVRALEDKQRTLLTKAGRMPAQRSVPNGTTLPTKSATRKKNGLN
jgi:hypothetical protein